MTDWRDSMSGDSSFLRFASSPVSSLLDSRDRDFTLLALSFARRWQQFDWLPVFGPHVLRLLDFLRRHGSYAACFHWFASIRRSPYTPDVFRERHVLRLLALLSLGHPLGAFPAPCGNFAALLFRFLPQEISRAKNARLRPLRARFLVATFPKSATRPWEQGTLASRCAGVSRVRFGQFRFGGKHNGTL